MSVLVQEYQAAVREATEPNFLPSERFDLALKRATEYHRRQPRKGSGTPYVGHLLLVAGYVLEDGGDEEEAIAALLHDALEDQYHDGLEDEIRDEFGIRVLEIVTGCSWDNLPGEKRGGQRPPWRERKQRYIDHMDKASTEVLRVSLADKLANLRSILRDHREVREGLWERFGASSPADVLWYYESLAERYATHRSGPLADEFAVEVERLRTIVQGA